MEVNISFLGISPHVLAVSQGGFLIQFTAELLDLSRTVIRRLTADESSLKSIQQLFSDLRTVGEGDIETDGGRRSGEAAALSVGINDLLHVFLGAIFEFHLVFLEAAWREKLGRCAVRSAEFKVFVLVLKRLSR